MDRYEDLSTIMFCGIVCLTDACLHRSRVGMKNVLEQAEAS